LNHTKTGPDVSGTDFARRLTALDWGWDVTETANRFLELSSKARKEGERYAIRTATNAAAIIETKGRAGDKSRLRNPLPISSIHCTPAKLYSSDN
jgi:hypothetical protein